MRVLQSGLIGLVRGYRFALSPWLGSACRFEPTCSAYALDALRVHGAGLGTALVIGRLARCHPWCAGGIDPVPTEPPRLFSVLLRAGGEGAATSLRRQAPVAESPESTSA